MNSLDIENSEGGLACRQAGFTLGEIMITIAVFMVLFGYGALNILQVTNKTSLRTTVDTIVTDIKQQQLKTMTGNTIQGVNDYYGIHFQSTSYILFHGTTFTNGTPTNITIPLDTNTQFVSDAFPLQNIIFTKGSGEVNGFVAGSNTIAVKNTKTGDIKTITINKYGIITQAN